MAVITTGNRRGVWFFIEGYAISQHCWWEGAGVLLWEVWFIAPVVLEEIDVMVVLMTDEGSLVKMFMGNGKTMPTMLPCASDEEVVMVEFGLRCREASYGGRCGILCKGFQAVLRWPRNIHLRMSNLLRESKAAEPVSPCSWGRRSRAATRLVIHSYFAAKVRARRL
eukprot:scaffold16796_cov70-Attheya_sp.AAC.3